MASATTIPVSLSTPATLFCVLLLIFSAVLKRLYEAQKFDALRRPIENENAAWHVIKYDKLSQIRGTIYNYTLM